MELTNPDLFFFSRNIKSLSDIQIVQVACGYYHSLALSKGKCCFYFLSPFQLSFFLSFFFFRGLSFIE